MTLLRLLALGGQAGGGDPDGEMPGPGRDVGTQPFRHERGRPGRQGLEVSSSSAGSP